MKRQDEEWVEIRTPKVIDKAVVQLSIDAPQFTHDIKLPTACEILTPNQ
ncbi:MAG: hypothetical protein GZ091_02445 [Paludibacter sp.]|nr:hypothetical protein [Paludibacter sp.]